MMKAVAASLLEELAGTGAAANESARWVKTTMLNRSASSSPAMTAVRASLTALELAPLHARGDIDDEGQAARQRAAAGQLGEGRQPQGVVAHGLVALGGEAEHRRPGQVAALPQDQGEVLPRRQLLVAEEDAGAVRVGPVHLGQPRQAGGGHLEGVLAAHLSPQHEQLHLQGLVGLGRQREGVVDAAVAGLEELHVLEFDPAAALGRKGEDAEAELVRGHLLDQGRIDPAAHDGIVGPARLFLLHDDPRHPLVVDPQHQIGDDGAFGQGEFVDPLHHSVGVVGEDLVGAGEGDALLDLHVDGDRSQLEMLAAVGADTGVDVADAEGWEGSQQGEKEGESGFHGQVLSLKRDRWDASGQ